LKIAVFSDIHGNISGLNAVLAAIDTLGGADLLFAAGDLLGGGPGTEDVLDLLLTRQVRMVRGNADEIIIDIDQGWQRLVAAGYLRHLAAMHPDQPTLDAEEAKRAWTNELLPMVTWTRERLSPPYRDILAALPLCESVEVSPGHKLLVCHATPASTWPIIGHPDTPIETLRTAYGAVDAEVIACGHLHFPHIQWLDAKLLVNVGCIEGRESRPGLCTFAILEYKQERWSVQQLETPYDVEEEARLRAERHVPG
jgi:predicted phosphodiesterase